MGEKDDEPDMLIVDAALGREVQRVPVWAMRQAGRYLPEYMKYTEGHGFFENCRDPDRACEITLQPARRFDLDAVIIFSDILVIPQALGIEVKMEPSKGPVFPKPMRTLEDWEEVKANKAGQLNLEPVAGVTVAEQLVQSAGKIVQELDYVRLAIEKVKETMANPSWNYRNVPVIGFVGSPWTLFVYMVEGGSSRLFAQCRRWLFAHPQETKEVMGVLAEACGEFLKMQIRGGARLVQVFDSNGGVLSREQFREFDKPYLQRVVNIVKAEYPDVPAIVFPKGSAYAVEEMKDSAYDVVGLDWCADLEPTAFAAQKAGKGVQGNLDPAALYAPHEDIIKLTHNMMDEVMRANIAAGISKGKVPQRYIANLGHGMHPDHTPSHLGCFMDAVHSYDAQARQL